MQHAFPKKLRLLKQADFQRVYRNAERHGSHFLILLVAKNGLAYPRLGCSIAKKNIRKAMRRNAIKRQIRESFRKRQHELTGLDIIVIAPKTSNELANSELQRCLEKHWQKLRHIVNDSC